MTKKFSYVYSPAEATLEMTQAGRPPVHSTKHAQQPPSPLDLPIWGGAA